MKNGLENHFAVKNNKKMAFGYTTGSCSAAAAKAAAIMMFTGQKISGVSLMTPKGILLSLEVKEAGIGEDYAVCAIQKDAGDDPDVTNGILVYARVSRMDCTTGGQPEIFIEGGTGVGRVTKPGLSQAVGESAINRVPREMICKAVTEICEENEYRGAVRVVISVPEGVEIAKKTFNPRLGIAGGISILGTSGIVEPMSEAALIASIRLEMQMLRSNGADYLVAAPGNYGTSYLSEHFPFDLEKAVKCSNFVGKTVDIAVELGFSGILFVSHIGKFIKVAGGIMNTHSRNADARMEILAANALLAGADLDALNKIVHGVTTDEGLAVLREQGLIEDTMKHVLSRVRFYLEHRAYGNLEAAAVLFSNEFGELGRTENADELMNKMLPA